MTAYIIRRLLLVIPTLLGIMLINFAVSPRESKGLFGIFDIFFTTKPVGKGTGLGLSISQNIIKLHGGNITFECPPEGGTTFIIELPLGFIEEPKEEPIFIGLDE